MEAWEYCADVLKNMGLICLSVAAVSFFIEGMSKFTFRFLTVFAFVFVAGGYVLVKCNQ